MGFWDWATTAREGVQGGIGAAGRGAQTAAGAVKGPAEGVANVLGWAANPISMLTSQQILNRQGGGNTPAAPTNAGGPQTPQTVTSLGWNPLAVNMFYNQAVAPMLSQLNSQFNDWNNQAMALQQSMPGQQYLTPDERAMTQLMPQHMAAENRNVAQAAEQAALVGPTIDAMQAQQGNIESALKTAYAEALKQNDITTAGLYTGASTPGTAGGTGGAPTPGSATAGAPLPQQAASQEIQNALQQAQVATAAPTSPTTVSPTSNVGAGTHVSGAGLSETQKQALRDQGFVVDG